jgi:hypothetical protein
MFRQGGSATLTEKKKWATAASLFLSATQNNEIFYVVYAPAEAIWELVYFAKIKSIKTTPEGATIYEIENLTPIPKPRPNKTMLIVSSTGKPMNENFIRPYAICRTPEFLMKPLSL